MRLSRTSLRLIAGAAALFGVLLTSCSGGDAPTATTSGPSGRTDCVATGIASHRGLQYLPAPAGVSPRSLQLDISTPQFDSGCAAPPVLLYVHGTNFRNGDASVAAGRVMGQLANDHGWGFAIMNYRLVGDAADGGLSNSYPEQLQDVLAAVQWLTAHGGENGVDGSRVALMGPASGGFLTAQAAVGDPKVTTDQLAAVRCAITVDTPGYDLSVVAAGSEGGKIGFKGDSPIGPPGRLPVRSTARSLRPSPEVGCSSSRKAPGISPTPRNSLATWAQAEGSRTSSRTPTTLKTSGRSWAGTARTWSRRQSWTC